MNRQREEDLQRRLEKLEAEIKSSSVDDAQKEAQKQKFQSAFSSFNSQLTRSLDWFNSLSGTKKLVALGVTAVLGLFVLQTVIKLVASVISVALLAVLVYVGYKFFVSSTSGRK
jgi:Flp pilus assembly protein TadB